MKRILVTLVGSLGLALAVSGCVPLDTPAPTPSAVPEHPAVSTSPTADIPDLEPYSTAGLEKQIEAMSKGSTARMLSAGKRPLDNAVPGSERILIADTVSGEHYAAFPETVESDTLSVSVLCSEPADVTFEVYDRFGRQVGSGQGECSAEGSFGASFGINERSKPSYIRVAAAVPVPVELSVVAFESTDRPPN